MRHDLIQRVASRYLKGGLIPPPPEMVQAIRSKVLEIISLDMIAFSNSEPSMSDQEISTFEKIYNTTEDIVVDMPYKAGGEALADLVVEARSLSKLNEWFEPILSELEHQDYRWKTKGRYDIRKIDRIVGSFWREIQKDTSRPDLQECGWLEKHTKGKRPKLIEWLVGVWFEIPINLRGWKYKQLASKLPRKKIRVHLTSNLSSKGDWDSSEWEMRLRYDRPSSCADDWLRSQLEKLMKTLEHELVHVGQSILALDVPSNPHPTNRAGLPSSKEDYSSEMYRDPSSRDAKKTDKRFSVRWP